MFDKIGKAQTLSQEIVENIEKAITDKKFSPNEKLPSEKELCEMFGVSRTAVREAIQMLSARGLIHVYKGKGIYVSDYAASNVVRPMSLFLELNFDIDYMLHLIHVRRILEPEIARDAAIKRTDEEVKELKKILAVFKQTSEKDFEKQGELDKDFHMVLANACKNPIIPVITEPIYQLMPKMKTLIYKNVDVARFDADVYHEKIYHAILNKKAKEAEKLMEKHLSIAEIHVNMLKEKM
mgnify:CR=1 FL=1